MTIRILRYSLVLLGITASGLAVPDALAQTWTKQSPNPTGLGILGVALPTPQHAFLATSNSQWDVGGALFESFDGAATWTQRDVPTTYDPLYGVFFLDANNGWTWGNINYRTTNGGATWTAMPFIGSTYYMKFWTTTFGYASTNGGLYVTRNGGTSWSPSPSNLYDFDFRDAQVGLGVSALNGLYRTTNGGTSFTVVKSGTGKDVEFLTSDIALAIVSDKFIRSTDGGLTWSAGVAAQGATQLVPLTSTTILAYAKPSVYNTDGRIFRSTDGGVSWTVLGTVIPDGISTIEFLDAQTAVLISSEADVWRSTDAGATWTLRLDAPAYGQNTWPVDFADAQTGLLAINNGLIYKTTDGGATWTQVSSGYGADLNDIDRFADGRLIAVGGGGFMGTALTSDDGAFWDVEDLNLQFAYNLVAVDVVDAQNVVAVDGNGRVFRSADRGETWSAPGAYPDPYLEFGAGDVHFLTPLEGWVVGSRYNFSAVYYTTDGGASWTVGYPTAGLYLGVDFEGDRGWIVDNGGYYLRTTDRGQTWVVGNLPSDSVERDLLDIEFFDQNTGYAVGWNGYAARSTDGGVTWTKLATPNRTDVFSDIYLLGPDDVWLSTYQDKVYHSTNGGQTWEVLTINSHPLAFDSFSGIAVSPTGQAWVVGYAGHIYGLGATTPPPTAPLDVELTVTGGAPVPVGGGTVTYEVAITNTTTASQITQYWVDVTPPSGRATKQGPYSVTVAAGATFRRTLSLRLTSRNPAGTYTLTGKVGTYPSTVIDSDAATFTKNATAATASAEGSGLPTAYALEAPVPNPFRDRTALRFALPEASPVTLAVFDGLGRRVALLLDGVRHEAGYHQAVFDASALPSGTYIARLVAGSYAETRRLTVIR